MTRSGLFVTWPNFSRAAIGKRERPLERDPEQQATVNELARLFEQACDSLPDAYRVVFMMRGIEEMSTSETAECLDVTEETVKVRFHRARALLRERFDDGVTEAAREAFSFLGERCARMVASVTSALRIPLPPPATTARLSW